MKKADRARRREPPVSPTNHVRGSPLAKAHPVVPLLFQPEWCRVTLASIGDGVITTDTQGRVTFLNPVAESLTGWHLQEAAGQPLGSVFRIINEESRQPVESPTVRALRDGVVVGLANHRLLIAKDGTERPIDDSAAPIRNAKGEVAGVVLVFRDISERRRHGTAGAGRPRLRRQHHCDLAGAVRRPRQEPAGPDGERPFLPTFPGLERGNRRPLHLRPGQRPVEHSPAADAAGESPAQKPFLPGLRRGTRLSGDWQEDHAAQRPPLRVGGQPARS